MGDSAFPGRGRGGMRDDPGPTAAVVAAYRVVIDSDHPEWCALGVDRSRASAPGAARS